MLTAIRDFVADSFSPEREAGGLRRFSVGELTVMVEQGPQALVAAVVRGEAPDDLLLRLQDTLETIHLQFAGALAEFDGDTEPFAAAQPLLEDCLATVVATDPEAESKSRRRWLPLVLAVVVVALILGGLILRSRMRWNEAVARLRAEPGIVVTEAERSWGTWRLRGPPRSACAGAGGAARRAGGRHRATSTSGGSPISRSGRRWCWPGPGARCGRRRG